MPNWKGSNTKSSDARARKQELDAAKKAQEQQQKEDAAWEDNDKGVNKKLNRKAEQAAKVEAKCDRKNEVKRLLDEEEKKVEGGKKKAEQPKKVTRAEIAVRMLAAQREEETDQPSKETVVCVHEVPLPENLNRNMSDTAQARNVDDAIAALEDDLQTDMHPERRRAQAYAAYEAEWMERYKAEYPSMKRSQLKDKIWKQWQKAPENVCANTRN